MSAAPTLVVLPDSHVYARCNECELKESRDKMGVCPSAKPAAWKSGGLMIVGEGPGYNEIRQKLPFIGKSGQLLDALLLPAGIRREEVYVANATSCEPPRSDENLPFPERFPHAVSSCLPRLEFEISQARPRVIVALGNAALLALTGTEREHTHRVGFPCAVCDPNGPSPDRKRSAKCPGCAGLKTRVVTSQTFEGEHSISWVAGSVIRTAGTWLADYGVEYIVPTYHPSYVMRKAETAAQKAIGGQFVAYAVVAHLAKAKRLLTSDAHWSLKTNVTDIPSDVEEFTRDADPAFPYAIDIETDAKLAYEVTQIKCIGIGRADRTDVLVVDTEGEADPAKSALIEAVGKFLRDPSKPKVLQNRMYDEIVVDRLWSILTRGTVGDTMFAHHALWPDELHDLHKIAFRYTDAPPWKPPKNRNGIQVFASKEEFWLYNARDVRATALSWQRMKDEMVAEDVAQVHANDLAMSDIAMDMTQAGLKVDKIKLGKIIDEERGKSAAAFEELKKIVAPLAAFAPRLSKKDETALARAAVPGKPDKKGVVPPSKWCTTCGLAVHTVPEGGEPIIKPGKPVPVARLLVCPGAPALEDYFNPDSHPQLARLLFTTDGFNLHPTKLTAKKQPATERAALREVKHPFITTLFAYRDAEKIIRDFGKYLAVEGRIHPQWNVHGAKTGRWSSSPNFQNWPKEMRAVVVPEEGNVFVGADYAALELRILAAMSGDVGMIEKLTNADENRKLEPEFDPHSYVAAMAFGSSFTSQPLDTPAGIKARKALREIAKRVVYALNYGAGAPKIVESVNSDEGYTGPPLTVEIVNRVIAAYHRAFPGVRKYTFEALKSARETDEVRSPILRRRRVFPLGDIDATIAMNHPIQSGAADVVNPAMGRIVKRLSRDCPTAFVIAQVHDAIYVECRRGDAELVSTILREEMPTTLKFHAHAPPMPIVAQPQVGETWAEAA